MDVSFNAARAMVESEEFLGSVKNRFSAFYQLTPDKVSLNFYQYFQLAAAAYSWKPDLIIELGRAYGNSTFAFTETMHALGGRVISLCNKDDWQTRVVPSISHLISPAWQQCLDARTVSNFVSVNLTQEINERQRILIFWDAHGFQTAEYVLGYLLPLMQNKHCLVIMHDVTDARFHSRDTSYNQQRLWRPETANEGSVKVKLGHFVSSSEQLVSVIDFCDRNKLPLQSADEDLRQNLSAQQNQALKNTLGDGFSCDAHWVYFQLNGSLNSGPLNFPFFNREHILKENQLRVEWNQFYEKKMPTAYGGLLTALSAILKKIKMMLTGN